MGILNAQFRALGRRELPQELRIAGDTHRLRTAFVHNFLSAVGLYECGDDRVVCKFHREAPFFGLPLLWLGKLSAAYEAAVLGQVGDLEGIPRLRARLGRTVVVRDFVAGTPLERGSDVSDEFFPQLIRLLNQLHQRGIAYVDLEKAPNILKGEDGRPHLIDFQAAFYVPERFLGQTAAVRCLRRLLQKADLYHGMKHYRRSRPDQLGPQGVEQTRRKPWPVMLGNLLMAPYKLLRRRILRRS